MTGRLVAALWLGLLALLSYGLLTPDPLPSVRAQLTPTESYVGSKTVHIGAYALLALLGAALPLKGRWRFLPLVVLSLHAGLTEYLQQFVRRGSSLTDVGYDHVGIVLGVVFTWPRWAGAADRQPPNRD